jgi:hypothetical protein
MIEKYDLGVGAEVFPVAPNAACRPEALVKPRERL